MSPRAYIFQRPFLRGLSTEGNLGLKIDWTSLIVGSKFTVFALLYFVFEGNFPITSPRGAYICRGDLKEGFLRYLFGGLIFGRAYTWRAYFQNFTVFYGKQSLGAPEIIRIIQNDSPQRSRTTLELPSHDYIWLDLT